ncbi:unnamed protein product [Menidia menidia]|uniref:(Atlantic silverside) hypothetical protein n=1 Tax=Menidia menidia TaxID=238744 RepID=A0A8S4AR72_9TELE|nr:unnamed protein product [Menidia menidia]
MPPSDLYCPMCQDVEDVKFVINYDYPNSSEDYIHRIGRTARSTNKGTAYTFFTPGNQRQGRELIRVLEEARQAINPKLLQLVDTGRGGGSGGGRSRFRGSNSDSNNPNLMYQEECDRRMRSVGGGGGGGSSKDGRGNGYGRSGHSRDGERSSSSSSSSYRDRSSRDGERSYGAGSTEQFQNNNGSGSGSGQALPPSSGPQPLMAQQINLPQPMMGLMGHSSYQFTPTPPSLSGQK